MTQLDEGARKTGLARYYRYWPIIFIAAAGVYIIFRYFEIPLFFLLIALCPLMHIFMHRSHGKHESHHPTTLITDDEAPNDPEDGCHG